MVLYVVLLIRMTGSMGYVVVAVEGRWDEGSWSLGFDATLPTISKLIFG